MACADALGRVGGRPASALPGLVSAARAEDADLRTEAVRRIGALQREGRGAGNRLLECGGDPSRRSGRPRRSLLRSSACAGTTFSEPSGASSTIPTRMCA